MTFRTGTYYGGGWTAGRRRNGKHRRGGGSRAARIQRLRDLGLSWRDIAALTGLSVRALRNYLADTDWPSPANAAQIDRAYRRLVG